MNGVAIDLGMIQIYWYSIILFIAMVVGLFFVYREAKKFNVPENFMVNLLFYTLIFGIIGARLYFVAFHWSYYSVNLLEIFMIWEGGLAIHGGIFFGLIWIIIYTRKYKIKTLRVLDFIVVGLLIGQVIGRWGNFFNGEAHGPATTLEFLQKLPIPKFIVEGMNIGGTYYQPTFLYESLWCLLGFGLLLFLRRLKYMKIGQITSIYMVWYSIGRFLIESLRTDSLMFGTLKAAQIVSITMFIAGIILFFIAGRGSKFKNQYNNLEENINVS